MTPELLLAPILLTAGQVVENRCFVLSPQFQSTTQLAAIYGGDVAGVVIRNVTLIGSQSWQQRWNDYADPITTPGMAGGLDGIRLQKCVKARIENVRIEGFPRVAIEGHGLDAALVRDITIRHCFQGINIGNPAPSSRMRIQRVAIRDLWGPGPDHWPGIGGEPSLERPGEFIGSDGIAAHKLLDSLVSDVSMTGECYGAFKFAFGCQRTEVSRLRGCNLQFDGGNEPTVDMRVLDCDIDKQLCIGAVAEVSTQVQNLSIERTRFHGGPGRNGHGAQLYGAGTSARFTGCRFDGFNGMAGTSPAYALETIAGGIANADFLSNNEFTNQQRVWLKS